jgi:hypothetical protein
MKKYFVMLSLMAMVFAAQAQTKFHDVECNDAKGPVKSITVKQKNIMGEVRVVMKFTQEGKLSDSEGTVISDAMYDNNGYLLSCVTATNGDKVNVSYEWEEGKVKTQTSSIGNIVMKVINNYDENGLISSASTEMAGNKSEMKMSDYKFDDHGNWISRKATQTVKILGQENTFISIFERSLEYYQ